MDNVLFTEIQEVTNRPKFYKFINTQQITHFLELLSERSLFIDTKTIIKLSPDPKDDFLVALCMDGQADYLITGDKVDLLALKQVGNANILSLTEFFRLPF